MRWYCCGACRCCIALKLAGGSQASFLFRLWLIRWGQRLECHGVSAIVLALPRQSFILVEDAVRPMRELVTTFLVYCAVMAL